MYNGHIAKKYKHMMSFTYFNIHVTVVSTELGGAYSSGTPGLTSISKVHVFTQFCHIERLKDLRLRNTTSWYCCILMLYFDVKLMLSFCFKIQHGYKLCRLSFTYF